MQTEKMEELLMELSKQMSAMQKDIEGIKAELHSNYIRSDENDTATRELVEERTKYACSRQDSIKAELKTEIELSKKSSELNKKQIDLLEDRIKALEDEKKNHVYSRWEQIREKAFWIIVAIIFAAVFKYINFVPPKPF
jgi:hypothetical protein